jgi:hypothetical protein
MASATALEREAQGRPFDGNTAGLAKSATAVILTSVVSHRIEED